MDDTPMEATIVFDSYLPDALRRALDYAGEKGFVASMPQLLHARANAPYDNIVWNTWFSSNSEESVVKTRAGHRVLVTVHGGGIFASPERFERVYRASVDRFSPDGYTGQYAAKISEQEARGVLEGRLPDGDEVPVYPFRELQRGIRDLPRRYAVVMDFETARNSSSGYLAFDDLCEQPLMIVRAGGAEAAAAYLGRARDRHNTKVMGNWHPYRRIDPDRPQTRVLFLTGNRDGVGTEDDDDEIYGYDADSGIGGESCIHNTSIINIARYVAVAPRDMGTSVRYLPFSYN
ncbi:MAG: hypothetical protein OXH52_20015 [Gammaproteobacteria bacterium]|nr:hypothetical protein [Gammaproteobacteria bacterium]